MDDPNKDSYGEHYKPMQLCSTCDHLPHKKGMCKPDCHCIASMEVRPRTGLNDGPPNSIVQYRNSNEPIDESSFVRVLMEEFVLAGYPGGDRTVVLQNVRKLLKKNGCSDCSRKTCRLSGDEIPI